MINGILLINKEKDITSYDVIRKLKKALPKGQKIGHAGTLDPFATGLLVILLGKSTKLMSRFLTMEKEYLVKAEFGYSTNTQDITGEVENKSTDLEKIKKKDIGIAIASNFLGHISQKPPIFSAKKIKGKKAYEYARKNESVNIDPKEIFVKDYKIVKYRWPFVEFKMICSSGTYVRTLIHDLGIQLGTYATAVELERTRIGKFKVRKALSSTKIKKDMKLNLEHLDNE